MFDDEDKIFAALRAGAAGYLLKRFASRELVPAIEQAHAGASPITPQIARQVFDFFRNQEGKSEPSAELDRADRTRARTAFRNGARQTLQGGGGSTGDQP